MGIDINKLKTKAVWIGIIVLLASGVLQLLSSIPFIFIVPPMITISVLLRRENMGGRVFKCFLLMLLAVASYFLALSLVSIMNNMGSYSIKQIASLWMSKVRKFYYSQIVVATVVLIGTVLIDLISNTLQEIGIIRNRVKYTRIKLKTRRMTSIAITVVAVFTNIWVDAALLFQIIASINYHNGFDNTNEEYNVQIKYIGVPLESVVTSPLVVPYFFNILREDMRVFTLDFSKFVPKHANIFGYEIKGQKVYLNSAVALARDSKLCVALRWNNYINQMIIENLIIHYSLDDEDYSISLSLNLKTTLVGNELILSSAKITTIHIKKNKNRSTITYDELPIEYCIKALYLHYYFSSENIAIKTKSNITENRKFLLHDGPYGTGKSVHNALSLMESGKTPIAISFWQENYEHEMLYLLFNRLREKTKSRMSLPTRATLFTFIAITISFTGVGVFILKNKELFPILRSGKQLLESAIRSNTESSSYIIGFPPELLLLFFAFLGILTSLYIAPEFIIYKNNSSEYYQDFFLSKISRMIIRHNAILIIEDIDRLDTTSIDKTLRLLANISYSMNSRQSILGIVSMDKKLVEEKYVLLNDTNRQNEIQRFNDQFDKVIISDVFRDEAIGSHQVVNEYLNEIFSFYRKCNEIWQINNKCEDKQKIIEKLDIVLNKNYGLKTTSLREVRSIIPTLVDSFNEDTKLDDTLGGLDSYYTRILETD